MKKLLSLIFIAGLFALASCGGSENKSNGSTSADSAAAAQAAAAKADSMMKMTSASPTQVSADTTKK